MVLTAIWKLSLGDLQTPPPSAHSSASSSPSSSSRASLNPSPVPGTPRLPNSQSRDENALLLAQNEILSTVERYDAPNEAKEATENMTGLVLAVTGLGTNYLIGYPFVTVRNRYQAFPTLFNTRSKSDAFLYLRHLNDTRRADGHASLWNGSTLSLTYQTITLVQEATIGVLVTKTFGVTAKSGLGTRIVAAIMRQCLGLSAFIPVFPLYQWSITGRLQPASRTTGSRWFVGEQNVITKYREIIERTFGKTTRDGKRFGTKRLHWTSLVLPAYCLHILTEKVQSFVCRKLFRMIKPKRKPVEGSFWNGEEGDLPNGTSVRYRERDRSQHKQHRYRNHGQIEEPEETMLHAFFPELVCIVTSNIISRVIAFPLETVVYRLLVQNTSFSLFSTSSYYFLPAESSEYSGFWDCVRRIYLEESGGSAPGISGFYRGFGAGIMAEALVGWVVLESTHFAYRSLVTYLNGRYEER